MKEILLQYASYNLWATHELTEAILLLPKEKQHEEVQSSFNSLFKTLLHIWDAESIWWQRLKLQERISVPSIDFKGDINDIIRNLSNLDRQWKEWITQAQEHMLQHVFQYQNSKKEQFKQPVYQMLFQVFNHATYHRGQLVTMMHQLGISRIPNTDFISWTRKNLKS